MTINKGIFFCLKTRESSAYGVMKCELSASKHTKHTFTLKTSKVKNFRCMCWVSVLHSCSSNELSYNNKIFCRKVDLLSVNSSGRRTREEGRRDHEGRKRGSKGKHLQMLPEEELTCQSSRRPVQRTQEPRFETHILHLLQLMSILSILHNGAVWGTFTETWFDGDRVRRVRSKQNVWWPPVRRKTEQQADCLKKLCRNIKDKGWRSTSGKKPSRILTLAPRPPPPSLGSGLAPLLVCQALHWVTWPLSLLVTSIQPVLSSSSSSHPPPPPKGHFLSAETFSLLRLPHVGLCGVDLAPPGLPLSARRLPLLLLLLILVLLGLALPQRDERRVQLVERDGGGVLDVLLQRVSAGLVLLHAAAHIDNQQRHDGQGEHGAHDGRQRHAAAPRRHHLHREARLLRGDVQAGGVHGGEGGGGSVRGGWGGRGGGQGGERGGDGEADTVLRGWEQVGQVVLLNVDWNL